MFFFVTILVKNVTTPLWSKKKFYETVVKPLEYTALADEGVMFADTIYAVIADATFPVTTNFPEPAKLMRVFFDMDKLPQEMEPETVKLIVVVEFVFDTTSGPVTTSFPVMLVVLTPAGPYVRLAHVREPEMFRVL